MRTKHLQGILGFDPSLVSSGYAYYESDHKVQVGRILSKKLRGAERLLWARGQYLTTLDDMNGADLVVYEGYSMGSRGRVFDIGELGGVLKATTYELGIDMLIVPPSTLKKYAVGTDGKGNAGKEQVMQAVQDHWGVELHSNDEADAYVLLQIGLHYLQRVDIRSRVRQQLIEKCVLVSGAN